MATKIGIVGVGDICRKIYLKNLTTVFSKEIEIVGVCDLIKERALWAQETYNIPVVYDTMEEMFENPEIEIVLNLTRPYEHYDVAKAALLAGKHVYCEKPLAASIAEGRELVKLAEEKGLMIGGAPDTFLGAGIQTCRKIIDEGTIGKPVGAAAFLISRGHEGWHPDPEFYYKYGGGPMMDMGPYYITSLINLLGGVKKVTGVCRTNFKQRTITSKPHNGEVIDVEVPTYHNAILQFDSGVTATLFTTFDVTYNRGSRFEVYGADGTLFVPDPNCFDGKISLLMNKRPQDKEFAKSKDPVEVPIEFKYAMNSRGLGLADMAKALRENRAPRCSYKQTLHVLEIMEAIVQSSDEERTITLQSHFERQEPMDPNLPEGVLD